MQDAAEAQRGAERSRRIAVSFAVASLVLIVAVFIVLGSGVV